LTKLPSLILAFMGHSVLTVTTDRQIITDRAISTDRVSKYTHKTRQIFHEEIY